MLTLVSILVAGESLTPDAFTALVDQNHGVPPLLTTMIIHDSRTGEDVSCWASWFGSNRKIGHEVVISTSAGTPVFKFLTKRLTMLK